MDCLIDWSVTIVDKKIEFIIVSKIIHKLNKAIKSN